MDDLKIPAISESEEMYLLMIALLAEGGVPEPVPLSRLSQALAVQPVSANQMVRRLAEQELLSYTPYHGVALTPVGRAVALRILRFRRLWEAFLIDRLGFPAGQVAGMACQLEHATTDELARRLAAFLGDPAVTPAGSPIPPAEDAPYNPQWAPLESLQAGQRARIQQAPAEAGLRSFLLSQGLHPGAVVEVAAAAGDGSMAILSGDQWVHLSNRAAQAVWVEIIAKEASR
jgi:DtxR family Mn-dependent transcriptional regulator